MLKRIVLGLVLLAGAAQAQTVADRVELVDALRGMGCRVEVLKDGNGDRMTAETGLEGQALWQVVESLVGDRLASFDPGRLIVELSPGLCGTSRFPREIVLDAARLYGCTLAPEVAAAHWAKVGITPGIADEILAKTAPGRTVPAEICALKPVHPDERTAWVAAFRENGCRIAADAWTDVSTRHGLPRDESPVISAWRAEGLVTGGAGRSATFLDLSVCAPEAAIASPEAGVLAAAMAGAGCRIDGRRLAAFAEGRGLPRDRAEAALAELVLSGQAVVEGDSVALTPEACAAALPESLALSLTARLDAAVAEGVSAYLRRNGCRVPVSVRSEEEALANVRAVLGLPRWRTAAADSLLSARIEAFVTSGAVRREDREMVLVECTP